MLNNDEKSALRYYIGDVSGDDAFYGDPKAYVVLNSLFFPDIATESARAAEGKYLNPAIISDIPRLEGFFGSLLSAFAKSCADSSVTTYRVERASDFELCRSRGMTVSMTSTSMAGFLRQYGDRRGIVLMRFDVTEGTHCIDATKLLDRYAKPEEAEILLPPFTSMQIEDIPLTEDELTITDCDGAQPISLCRVQLGGIVKIAETPQYTELSADGSAAGMRVYEALNAHRQPEPEDIELYSQWKSALVYRLNRHLTEICK